jgi:cohesin loading factor subunit SCC2
MARGEPVALMGPLYSDIKTKKKFRGRFLKSLVSLLDHDSHSNTSTTPAEVDFARFIVENLVYLEYGVLEEVFYVIHTIDRILSSTGVSLLHAIEGGEMTGSMAILAQRSIVLSLLVGLKQHLKVAYSLTEAKCQAFDPKKAGGAKDNKTAVRMRELGVIEWSEIPYADKEIQEDWQAQEQLQAVLRLLTTLTIVYGINASR